MKKENKIFMISGPSGAGEDSVMKGIKKKIKFNRIRTTVTRKPRIGESQGKPYFFVSVPKFKKMLAKKEFIEWAIVYGDYRGATKKEVERTLRLKNPVLWKVDWQGVVAIKKIMPQAISIMIAPGSYEELENRLIKRKQDSLETIKKRKQESLDWLKRKKAYDYIVMNKDGQLPQTINKVQKIIEKELKS